MFIAGPEPACEDDDSCMAVLYEASCWVVGIWRVDVNDISCALRLFTSAFVVPGTAVSVIVAARAIPWIFLLPAISSADSTSPSRPSFLPSGSCSSCSSCSSSLSAPIVCGDRSNKLRVCPTMREGRMFGVLGDVDPGVKASAGLLCGGAGAGLCCEALSYGDGAGFARLRCVGTGDSAELCSKLCTEL